MRRLLIIGPLVSILGLSSGCSSNENGTSHDHETAAGGDDGIIFSAGGIGSGEGGASGTGSHGGSSASSSSAGGADPLSSPGGSSNGTPGKCSAPSDESGCVGELYVGETIPLDIYVMFDQSGSMLNMEEGGVTRMDAVRTAVGRFLKYP